MGHLRGLALRPRRLGQQHQVTDQTLAPEAKNRARPPNRFGQLTRLPSLVEPD